MGPLKRSTANLIKTGAFTAALTFASFYALMGFEEAAIGLCVIFLHELGHVIAMRWAGMAVRGIYFIPFIGGVAVGDSWASKQITSGAVALMGPALSIPATAIFTLLAAPDRPIITSLAVASSFINGLNLLPIVPLDGGHVVQALLSRVPPIALRIINAATFAGGVALAWALGENLLLALFLLVAPSLLTKRKLTRESAPLSRNELAWLAIGYAATTAFYILILLRFIDLPSVVLGALQADD